ncbi:unnamed protein product [Mytilus edulis]|uniref:Retrotransposon gag domain-containing protein n=1 Tax=Mytilus edulis TaxID=6550 RepID=A0A8S3V2N3_MYTED|nr:unnamed protein product [Mytilus edulis]
MQPQNAVIMDQPIVEEIHVQPENQPPPPVENQPLVLQDQPPLVPVQPPPVQAAASGQGSNRPTPPGFTNSKIMVNLKHYNGDTDAVQWWASFLAYITLQRMAEWEAILVLPFYLCGIAEQWFEMIDSTTKASLAHIKLSFLNRFKQHKQEDIGLTYLRQQENEPVDQYIHRALNYNKTNKLTQKFVKIPTTLTLSFLQSYRIKKVLEQPFNAYIYVTHQGFATMLSQPANVSKQTVQALAADSDSLYPSLLA